MCGRYFWNDDAEDAFEEDFPELAGEIYKLRAGDYTPAMSALAVTAASGAASEAAGRGDAGRMSRAGSALGASPVAASAAQGAPAQQLTARFLQWGFPGYDKGKLLINARAESVKEKRTFADSFLARRCVLPAAGFYEWDRKKEKVIFTVPDRPILYLAGIYRPYGPEKRFVVLTREANASMAPMHDRMPLILTRAEVEPWVRDTGEAENILAKELPMLKAERPYEQITFEW